MPRKPSPGRACTGMTKAKAVKFMATLAKVQSLGHPKLFIQCGWENRRFMIQSCSVFPPNNNQVVNENIIVIKTNIDDESFVNAIIKFGAQREYEYRNRNKSDFEAALSNDDEIIHLVPQYSHIALCKHKSSAWGPSLKLTPDPSIWCRDCWKAAGEDGRSQNGFS